MPLPATCIDLAMIILIEGSQIEEDRQPRISLRGRIEKSVSINSSTKQKQTHRLRKVTSDHQREKVGWREVVRRSGLPHSQ